MNITETKNPVNKLFLRIWCGGQEEYVVFARITHKRVVISDITISMKALDYLQMPECIFTRHEVEMNSQEKKLYEMLARDLLIPLEDGDIDAANAAALSGKLLQMANGAVYDENGSAREIHSQ